MKPTMRVVDAIYRFFDRAWVYWLLTVLIAVDLLIAGLTWGDTRLVIVRGTTWEWTNAPPGAAGMVYSWDMPCPDSDTWSPPDGMELQRLQHVYVTYYAVYRSFAEKAFAISSFNGTFSKGTRPWQLTNDITINLIAEREGYVTVNATFPNKSTYLLKTNPNVVHIIMVAEPALP